MNNEQTQDLRESVKARMKANDILLGKLNADPWGNTIWKHADVIEAMLQFAAEVSAEKDKRIAELEAELEQYMEAFRWFEGDHKARSPQEIFAAKK